MGVVLSVGAGPLRSMIVLIINPLLSLNQYIGVPYAVFNALLTKSFARPFFVCATYRFIFLSTIAAMAICFPSGDHDV